MHSLRNKKRKAGGFTLGEMLATVAIIGILLAIAIPSALTIQRDLKLLELDNAARDIFIAAQNRLTALRASDGLDTVDSNNSAIDDPNAPTDIGALVYVDNKDGMFDVLLPARAIDRSLFDGKAKAVIEYNPQSASVYAVFYSEQDFTYNAETPRGHNERREHDPMLGYYGGDAAQMPGSDTIKPPAISIENAEELKLIIDNSGIEGINDEYQKVLGKLAYTVTLTQTDKEQNTVKLQPIAAEQFQENKYELVLDSLSGLHFADLVRKDGAVAIDPGADIRVSVEIEYTGDEFVARKYTWTGETNSLFAARGDTEIENGETKETLKDAVQIACGRHLQNLDPAVSGLGQGKEPTNAYQPVNVVLTSDIDWKARKDMDNTTAFGGGSIGDDGATIKPATLAKADEFCSIQNEHIKRVEGAKHEIKNLRIVGHESDQDVGLFTSLTGTEKTATGAATVARVSDLYLVNPRLESSGSTLGLLVGYAAYAEITNCRVYLDENVRKALKSEKQAGEKEYGIFAGTGETTVGGLIGKASRCKLQKSFAALPKISAPAGNAGGLCGELNDTTLKQCYASITALSGKNVGGFAYQTGEKVSITNCYATGALSATERAAGFIQAMSSNSTATMQTCYAAVSYAGGFDKEKDIPFSPQNASAEGSDVNYYVTDIVNGPVKPKEDPKRVEPLSYKKMKEKVGTFGATVYGSAIWGNNAEVTTKPYTMKPYAEIKPEETKSRVDEKLYSDTVYPFPRLAALYHYGDWPLPAKTGILAYYERYTNDSFGLVCATAADELPAALKDKYPLSDTNPVLRDGYLWLTEGEAKTLTLSIGGANKELQATAAFQLDGFTVFELPEPTDTPQNYYLGVAPAGQTAELWYNPYFAQTAVHSQAAPQSRPDSISVRTARQLTALGGDPAYWTDAYTFRQGRSIDYTSYDPERKLTLPSIGTDKDSFAGTYDGGSHPIITTGSDKGGLFDQNEGTLQNIVLRAAASGQTISGSGTTGALADQVLEGGSITNCAVSGFAVSTTGSAAAGGLVGTCYGTIANSAADSASVSGLSAGGLVGNMNGGSVSNCYALGKLTAETAVGGIATGTDSNVQISNSYSACTIENAAGKDTVYGVAPFGVENCAYLAQQITGKVHQVNGVKVASYDELKSVFSGAFGAVSDANTHPYASEGAYPFPSSVKNAAGVYVHYGDWPEEKETPGVGDLGFIKTKQTGTGWQSEKIEYKLLFYRFDMKAGTLETTPFRTETGMYTYLHSEYIYFSDSMKNSNYGIQYNKSVQDVDAFSAIPSTYNGPSAKIALPTDLGIAYAYSRGNIPTGICQQVTPSAETGWNRWKLVYQLDMSKLS